MNITIANSSTSTASSTSAPASGPSFTFLPLPARKLPSLDRREVRELLMKWGMLGRLRSQTFTFDEAFRPYEARAFTAAFFASPTVLSNLELSSGGVLGQRKELEVAEMTPVPSTHLSMALFDRLEGPVVREGSGLLRKCFDDWVDDILISDELRQMLLVEDSESYLLYGEEEMEEFLFRLFGHLALGGQVCQFEDSVEPYLESTRALYKELMSVQKEGSNTGDGAKLRVISHVYRVVVRDSCGVCYPENEHRNSFAYLVVDPLKRLVTTFHHSFGISDTVV